MGRPERTLGVSGEASNTVTFTATGSLRRIPSGQPALRA